MPFIKMKAALVAALLSAFASRTFAAPSVNVALQTSFDAPPFLIELL